MTDFLLSEEEEQQVEEGEAARLLLESPEFLLAIERVRNQCAEGILTSDPHKADARENLYNLSRGLSAVTAELQQMVSTAETIIENATLLNEEAEVHENDHPGFDF